MRLVYAATTGEAPQCCGHISRAARGMYLLINARHGQVRRGWAARLLHIASGACPAAGHLLTSPTSPVCWPPMGSAPQPSAGVAFGRFRVLPRRRELLADGQPVALGGRTFDVLMTLIEARGAVVSTD